MIDDAILRDAEALLGECRAAGLRIATAESCTGGLIAAALTAIAGSSDVVDRGFVTYSNQAKTDLVGVPPEVIGAEGAVSEAVARLMAEGAVLASLADIAIAVTGVAGPGGGTAAKPVGLVWFGCARRGLPTIARRRIFPGDRTQVRAASVGFALALLREVAAGPRA
jgi:nicotinamide-nucleotide amidase